MISVEGVTKRYGDLVAVDNVSFEIDRGEVVGFLGPNGAGKSTTMKMLTGSLQPDEGMVRFDGVSIGEDLIEAKRRIGYLPETNALYPDMIVSEYLDFTCDLRDIPKANRNRALARAVDQTGIEAVFTRPISQLSKGYRQRTGLAAAILHEPEILILDEPTEGLDPNQRVGIRQLIRDLGQEHTVLLSTHVLGEVEATCSRLMIINKGQMVAQGTVEEILSQEKEQYVYTVEAAGDGLVEHLKSWPEAIKVEAEPVHGRLRVEVTSRDPSDLRPRIFEAARDNGWTLWELHRSQESLEQVFRHLTVSQDGSETADEGDTSEMDDVPAEPVEQSITDDEGDRR